MVLNINPSALSHLKSELNRILYSAKISPQNSLDTNTWIEFRGLETVVSGNPENKNRQILNKLIGENAVFTFFVQSTHQLISERRKYKEEGQDVLIRTLTEIPNAEDFAEILVNKFVSLPWAYSNLLFMNENLSNFLRNYIDKSPSHNPISIVEMTTKFNKNFPKKQSNRGILDKSMYEYIFEQTDKWNNKCLGLQIFKSGFIDLYSMTETKRYFENTVKAFFGLGIATKIFDIDNNVEVNNIRDKQFHIHVKQAKNWGILGSSRLSKSLANTLEKIIPNKKVFDTIDNATADPAIKYSIKIILQMFDNPQETKQLRLAAQWFFDSYRNEDNLLSFIQLMTVLEILLGNKAESDKIGLGNLLKNRCAYFIANTIEEREFILKSFDEIYDVRSRILHDGKSHLNASDIGSFIKLQHICNRLISKELKIFRANLSN